MAEYRITVEVHDEAGEAACKDVWLLHSHWETLARVCTSADSVKEALEWAVTAEVITGG